MVIAMVTVRVMQMAVHQIIHVVTVGHGFMAASGTVNVARLMPGALVRRRTGARILL